MLTTQERLSYCIVCQNRKFDPNKGLVCGLTLLNPTFEYSCEDFVADEVRKEELKEKVVDIFDEEDPILPVSASIRFVNFIIDRIIVIALGFLFLILIEDTEIGYSIINSDSIIVDYIFGAILSLIYYSIIEAATGKSIGKMITKTVVVKEDGTKPEIGDYLTRSFVRIIPFEPFSFLGDGVGWHDTFTNTRVVKKDSLKDSHTNEILDDFGN